MKLQTITSNVKYSEMFVYDYFFFEKAQELYIADTFL